MDSYDDAYFERFPASQRGLGSWPNTISHSHPDLVFYLLVFYLLAPS